MVGSWWSVVEGVSMNPKNSVFEEVDVCGVSVVDCRCVFPSSTNPSRSVGTSILFFGILTTPLFWSSRMSTILFRFLKIMVGLGDLSI